MSGVLAGVGGGRGRWEEGGGVLGASIQLALTFHVQTGVVCGRAGAKTVGGFFIHCSTGWLSEIWFPLHVLEEETEAQIHKGQIN